MSRIHCKHSWNFSVQSQYQGTPDAVSSSTSAPINVFPGGYAGVKRSYEAVFQQIWYRSFAKKWRANRLFNFITTEYIVLKLCISLSITHTNSGKEIQKFSIIK